ncbi:MAG TPA: MFS transporter [Actinocrinis sp.]|nr:MFS transporter [Actinocrinis sp.]
MVDLAANRLAVLRIRDFRILLIERLLAPASFAFTQVGVSFAVLDRTHSTADLSYVLAMQIVPTLFFTLISGVFSDRFRPQRVIVVANALIALCEGGLGVLVLTHHDPLAAFLILEFGTGTAMALFYPASLALLPKIVPENLLQEANAISRLAMNSALMGGAAVAGLVVAAAGPGWALTVCGIGMASTLPALLTIRAVANVSEKSPDMLRELREGWVEFRSHIWIWATVLQYTIVLMCWYGSFTVLGPVVAQTKLGGPSAWGLIMASESVGLILGGVWALRFTPKRPMLFVVLVGATIGLPSLTLALLSPLWLVCGASFGVGVVLELMMVQWNLALATRIPADRLARVSAYDTLGSTMTMPVGALIAGPLAAQIGVSSTQFGAVGLILLASLAPLLSAEIRQDRGLSAEPGPGLGTGGGSAREAGGVEGEPAISSVA